MSDGFSCTLMGRLLALFRLHWPRKIRTPQYETMETTSELVIIHAGLRALNRKFDAMNDRLLIIERKQDGLARLFQADIAAHCGQAAHCGHKEV